MRAPSWSRRCKSATFAPDPVHLAVQDLEDERRGEDLLDPGRGYAEEAVLHAAVGGARRDPISLGDRVVLLSGLRDLARTDRSTSIRIGQRRDRPRLGSPGTR
jgi:hypothetical protein